MRDPYPKWIPNFDQLKQKLQVRNWELDPLGLPWILLMAGMLILMHLFLVLIPVVGLFLVMLPWFFIPGFYIFVKSSNFSRYKTEWKIVISTIFAVLLVALVIFMSLIA